MSLHTIFMLTIECPECGKIHKFSVDGVLEKGTIYCSCGKTIIVDNANQFIEKIDELERPSPQVTFSTTEEKEKVEKLKVEKPKTEKLQTEKPKTEKPKEAKAKVEKPKAEKPQEKITKKKKSNKEEAKK
jgi:outer membrane biosynthesis protein TonB